MKIASPELEHGADRIDPQDVDTCLRVLRRLARSPEAVAALSRGDRYLLRSTAGELLAIPKDDAKILRRVRRKHESRTRKEQRAEDARLRSASLQNQDRAAQKAAAQGAEVPRLPAPDGDELQIPRTCYVCKKSYKHLHPFYASLCRACGDFNFAKRTPVGPLEGKVALITGGRVKIGFYASLMLLRSGCRVVVTTRFPRDAADRYAREPDFATWADRVQIYGLDLRHAPSVELFARYMEASLDRLDFLLNNAAQTVRRPPGFYAHLLENEERPWQELPAHERRLLAGHEGMSHALRDRPALAASLDGPPAPVSAVLGAWSGGASGVGLWASARLSQLPYDQEAVEPPPGLFPPGALDMDRQQVDLRGVNSWRLRLADVSTPEMLEVHLVNTVAPFVLNARLKPLMVRTPGTHKHVVNVSAMEGQFSRGTKTDKHPHTNMAKAALNMMTRTSAADYVRDGIHMNSVDTGWVTDEDPAAIAARKAEELDFQPPLDAVDGAARIVDPIFAGFETGEPVWGKFLKDYRPTDW